MTVLSRSARAERGPVRVVDLVVAGAAPPARARGGRGAASRSARRRPGRGRSAQNTDQARSRPAVALTDGDRPVAVSIRPCTIHGWRPFSVSTQPAVFIRNGEQHRPGRAPQEHPGGVEPAPPQQEHPPQRRAGPRAPPRYAITRIDQYWTKTFGHVGHLAVLWNCCWYCALTSFMPRTGPFQVPVASSDSRCGISMIFVGVSSSLPPPIWNAENEHGWQVCPLRLRRRRSSSAGTSPRSCPSWLPTPELQQDGGSSTTRRRASPSGGTASTSLLRRRCHADTASITARRRPARPARRAA